MISRSLPSIYNHAHHTSAGTTREFRLFFFIASTPRCLSESRLGCVAVTGLPFVGSPSSSRDLRATRAPRRGGICRLCQAPVSAAAVRTSQSDSGIGRYYASHIAPATSRGAARLAAGGASVYASGQ
ncbi:hypothetical protein MRX96_019073 [Rhipicephalus microplus]